MRTSYIRVRLEFLRYPHLIPYFFNSSGFGPPWNFTSTSAWTWVGHPVSGRILQTLRAINTRFPFGFGTEYLNLACNIHSLDRSTKSTISHMKSALSACKHRVSGSFSLPFRGSFQLSITVLSAIGHQVVFRLGGWSPRLPTGFLVSGGTLDPALSISFSLTGLLPTMVCLPIHFC